ncbi:MAG: 50S ribosomal protein L32 [Desulfarculus sp.]|nr:MAG: 50S ribosomal protein L32 [Desulfarculus sp.]
MALPKRRHSVTRRNRRRAHDAITLPNVAACPQCGEPKLPHRICPSCGTYKGRQVVTKEE